MTESQDNMTSPLSLASLARLPGLSEMQQLLEPSLGPCGRQVMVTTATGQLLVTSDGMSLMNVLHPSHPVTIATVAAVSRHHRHCRDGTKTFMVILNNLLKQISCRVSKSTLDSSSGILLAQAFHLLMTEIIPHTILPKLTDHIITMDLTSLPLDQVKEVCQNVLQTCMCSKDSSLKVARLARVTSDLVFKSTNDVTLLTKSLGDIIDKFDDLCVEIPGGNVMDSCIIKGILIDRHFTVPPKMDGESINFVLLDCDITRALKDTTMHVKNVECGIETLTWKSKLVKLVIDKLKQLAIRVIILTMLPEDNFKFFCRKEGIGIIAAISQETLKFVESMTGVLPIRDVRELLIDHNDKHIGVASKCEQTVLHGKLCINLVPVINIERQTTESGYNTHTAQCTSNKGQSEHCDKTCDTYGTNCSNVCHNDVCHNDVCHNAVCHNGVCHNDVCHTMILYAPTQGLCRQYCNMVASGIMALKMALEDLHIVDKDMPLYDHGPVETARDQNSTKAFDGKCDSLVGSKVTQNNHHLKTCQKSPDDLIAKGNFTSLSQSPLHLRLIPSGGAFEFLMHFYLKEYLMNFQTGVITDPNQTKPEMIQACDVLAQTLLHIPQILHQNSYAVKDSNSSFIKMYDSANKVIKSGGTPCIHAKTGEVLDSKLSTGPLEPLYSKVALVNSVLMLIQQILRLDAIISVKSLQGVTKTNHVQYDQQTSDDSDCTDNSDTD